METLALLTLLSILTVLVTTCIRRKQRHGVRVSVNGRIEWTLRRPSFWAQVWREIWR